MNLPMIPQDKANHFIYGQVIFAAVYLIASKLPAKFSVEAALIAMVAVVLAAALKEWVLDKRDPERHTVDPRDFIVTCLGGFAVWGLTYLRQTHC